MITHRLAIVMLCLMTTGCATSWAKVPDVKEAIDRYNCQKEFKDFKNATDNDTADAKCMKAKGDPLPADKKKLSPEEIRALEIQAFYVDRFECWKESKDRSQRYFEACMQAKGYEKRPSTSESEGKLVQ